MFCIRMFCVSNQGHAYDNVFWWSRHRQDDKVQSTGSLSHNFFQLYNEIEKQRYQLDRPVPDANLTRNPSLHMRDSNDSPGPFIQLEAVDWRIKRWSSPSSYLALPQFVNLEWCSVMWDASGQNVSTILTDQKRGSKAKNIDRLLQKHRLAQPQSRANIPHAQIENTYLSWNRARQT